MLEKNNEVATAIIELQTRVPDVRLICACLEPEGAVLAVFFRPVVTADPYTEDRLVKMCNARLPKTDENDLFSAGFRFSTIRASQIVKNDECDFDGYDWNRASVIVDGTTDAYLCAWEGLPKRVTEAYRQGLDEYLDTLVERL